MRRIRIFVAYDGTNYCGWQIQPNGITIEEKLNKALNRLTGEDIRVIGASRTDSGVHALGNVAVFDTESPIPPERFSYALNQRLPEDIVVVKSDEVPLDWHPRYQDNISKTYEYHIYNAQMPNPLKTRYCTFVSFPLDIGAMREGAKYLIGAHDFVSFCNIRTNTQDTVRTVYDLTIEKKDDEIVLRITGNGFFIQHGPHYRRCPDPGRQRVLYSRKSKRDSGSQSPYFRRGHSIAKRTGIGKNRL